MGRALLHYLPRAVSALVLSECLLSFMLVYLLLAPPGAAVQAPAALCNALGASLSFAIGSTTLIMVGQSGDTYFARRELLFTTLVAGLVALPLMSATHAVLGEAPQGVASIVAVWAVWLLTISLFRTVLSLTLDHTRPKRRVLILGDPNRVEAVSLRLLRTRHALFEPLTSEPARLSSELVRHQGIAAIIVSGTTPAAAMSALLDCKLRGTPVVSDRVFQERHLGRIDLDALTAEDLVFADGFAEGWVARALKRASDIAIAFCLLVLSLPLMIITGIVIKADSPGPVFYRQQRVGYLGRPFTLVKFRSMTVDAEAGGPAWAQHADPRITRVGSFIRATRIDELPQLVNVLLGQMSLVGPRPERPHFVRQLAEAIPFYHERSYVKPGVTGWAQVNYPYGASVEDAREKLAYDLFYVKHRGVLLDLFILLATIRVVLFREGAR